MLVILALVRGGDGCGSSAPAAGSGGSAAGSDKVAAALERFAAGSAADGSAVGSAATSLAAAAAGKPAKAAPAATTKSGDGWKNYFPEYGPRWGAARMREVIQFEYNKDTWDNGSVRKEAGETYYGSIYVAYRCDNRNGCPKRGTGQGWKPIAWWLNN
jgi:hypothetical protein